MKNTAAKKETKFIASLKKESKPEKIEEIAKIFNSDDAVTVNHVSPMLGYISGKASASIEELQHKYQSQGVNIEPDRTVKAK